MKTPFTTPWTREVIGDSGNRYTVRTDAGAWSCTCPDYSYRHRECKHIRQVRQQEQTLTETTLATVAEPHARTMAGTGPTLTREQTELVKRTVAVGATDDELALFFHACKRTGLDPLMKQIYAIKRKGKLTIQTGIDGYRLIADRTGRYAPGRAPTFAYNDEGSLISATAYVKKQTLDGHWHEVAATAHFREYVQVYEGKPSSMWADKPHIMLAKCAEALALRRAFPAEMSGVYTPDELRGDDPEIGPTPGQATAPPARLAAANPAGDPEPMTPEQGLEIDRLATELGHPPEKFKAYVRRIFSRDVTELDHDQAKHLIDRLETAALAKGGKRNGAAAGREPGEEG